MATRQPAEPEVTATHRDMQVTVDGNPYILDEEGNWTGRDPDIVSALTRATNIMGIYDAAVAVSRMNAPFVEVTRRETVPEP